MEHKHTKHHQESKQENVIIEKKNTMFWSNSPGNGPLVNHILQVGAKTVSSCLGKFPDFWKQNGPG